MTFSSSNPHPPEPPPAVLPAERGVAIYYTCVIMPLITFIFVALRFYTRAFIVKLLTLADYVAFLTMPFIIAYSMTLATATYNGMGLHVWQYTEKLKETYYLWIGISSEFYVLSLAGYKSALLLLYLQLFGINRKFRMVCYITLFYVLGYLFCNLITQFLGCDPPAKTYKPSLPGHCINSVAADIAYGAGHMTSDLIIAILPLPIVWRLQFRSPREKLGISLVLGSGFIAWAIACIRWAISTSDLVSYDRPFIAGLGFLFSVLEVNFGLICACTPTLKPLMHSVAKHTSEWYASYQSSHSSRKGFGSHGTARSGSAESEKKRFVTTKKSTLLPHIDQDSTTSSETRIEVERMPSVPPVPRHMPLAEKMPGGRDPVYDV